jgi:multidrug efflux pump subunit AcrB
MNHAAKDRNIPRFFTAYPQVGYILMLLCMVFGAISYRSMPKRKDPYLEPRIAVAGALWPGASAADVEALITRKIEDAVRQSGDVETVLSTSRSGASIVTIILREDMRPEDVAPTLDRIDLKLQSVSNLPPGSSPVQLQKDFGDTATLLLSVSSPLAPPAELDLRGRAVNDAVQRARAGKLQPRTSLVISFPLSVPSSTLRYVADAVAREVRSRSPSDAITLEGEGFVGVDTALPRAAWEAVLSALKSGEFRSNDLPADLWTPVVVEDPAKAREALASNPGDRDSYRELTLQTEQLASRLRNLPSVTKVLRVGIPDEHFLVQYSPSELLGHGVSLENLRSALANNGVLGGGASTVQDERYVRVASARPLTNEQDIAKTPLTTDAERRALRLGDVATVARVQEADSYVLFASGWHEGKWRRGKAIALSVQMRNGNQVADFEREIKRELEVSKKLLAENVEVVRISDQAEQVHERVSLFLWSLFEAIAIIILVGLIGFRELRSSLILAISIVVTLALTFVFMALLRVDIQQMSIASLILALGLLVDDPVVASDAIKSELEQGQPREVAAWLGPTKRARAIFFATVANIVAYLPFLLLKGHVGTFVYSLPIVMTCALVASRIVSMTFIPLLGLALLRPREPEIALLRTLSGYFDFQRGYRALSAWVLCRRKGVLLGSLGLLACGALSAYSLPSSFFPREDTRLFVVDIRLPEDSTHAATDRITQTVDEIVTKTSARVSPPGTNVLTRVTTFVGGGAPRFWYSLPSEEHRSNVAQLLVEVSDEKYTERFALILSNDLRASIAEGRVDVRHLEHGKSGGLPVEVRVSGDNPQELRRLAAEIANMMREDRDAFSVRDDWGVDALRVRVEVDAEKAAAAGVTQADVTRTTLSGYAGFPLGVARDGERLVPIIARADSQERAADPGALTVLGRSGKPVPVEQVAKLSLESSAEQIHHRDSERTITVGCLTRTGVLPAEIMARLRPKLALLSQKLAPGYSLRVGGVEEDIKKVQSQGWLVAGASLLAIFLTLLFQFRNLFKAGLVLGSIPFGVAAAFTTLFVTRSSFGFMALVGVISLAGVIVSHVVVLFDFIEDAEEAGMPFEQAIADAGIRRFRPVMITVGATVLGLVPLGLHGGALWRPLCLAQIGGLTFATMVTLLLVPAAYATLVLDLRWIRWGGEARHLVTNGDKR